MGLGGRWSGGGERFLSEGLERETESECVYIAIETGDGGGSRTKQLVAKVQESEDIALGEGCDVYLP